MELLRFGALAAIGLTLFAVGYFVGYVRGASETMEWTREKWMETFDALSKDEYGANEKEIEKWLTK